MKMAVKFHSKFAVDIGSADIGERWLAACIGPLDRSVGVNSGSGLLRVGCSAVGS